MSADQITDTRIAEIELLAKHLRSDGKIVGAILCELLDALTASRAEAQRLTEQVERFKTGAVRVSLDGAVYFEPYVQLLRDEITKLREEARRSDAGRVEVPERRWTGGYPDLAPRSRLSPSPQPAIRITAVGDDGAPREVAYSSTSEYRSDGSVEHVSRVGGVVTSRTVTPAPQPSADVVVVPREDAELAVQWFHAVQDLNPKFLNSEDGVAYKRFCALRSSTNHDSKETP